MIKKTREVLTKQETKTYPHTIFYDCELFHDKEQRHKCTISLTHENTNVPISVSIADTLERETTHIFDADPKELIQKFIGELERRRKKTFGSWSEQEFMLGEIDLIPGKQQRAIVEWCDQVPVLGFNCGRYDLNRIKEHSKLQLGKRQTQRCS